MDSPSTEGRLSAAGFARHIGRFSAATMASRVLGYARDALIMFTFGGGAMTDAYVAAFRTANFFRRSLGEGALNSSVVPVLEREKNISLDQARSLFYSLCAGVLIVSSVLTAAGVLGARPLVLLTAYGFSFDPGLFDLTVVLTQILFPSLIFVTLAAVCQSGLNVMRRFFLPALAPVCFSISIILYFVLLHLGLLPLHDVRSQLMGLALFATLGSLVQFLVQFLALFKTQLKCRLRSPLSHPGIYQVLSLMGPSLVASAADQVDTYVSMAFATFLAAGSVTALYNAQRVMQLPLALFGVATAVVALPQLSSLASRRDEEGMAETLGLSLRMLGFLLFPAMAGLWVIGLPIIQVLFERGRFTGTHSLMAYQALLCYAFSIFSYSVNKLCVSAFYAHKDAKTPVKISVAAVGVNALLSFFLMRRMGVAGLALAASVSSWLAMGCMLRQLQKKLPRPLWRGNARSLLKSLAASALMALVCLGLKAYFGAASGRLVAACMLAAPPVYYLLSVLFDIEERRCVGAAFRGQGEIR